jgi:hypothetical protein
MVDRGDPSTDGGDGVGPPPYFGAGVGRVDEVGSDGDRVRG